MGGQLAVVTTLRARLPRATVTGGGADAAASFASLQTRRVDWTRGTPGERAAREASFRAAVAPRGALLLSNARRELPSESLRGVAWLANNIIDLTKSSEDKIGISSSGGRGGRRRAAPTFFGDAGIRDALETNALEQLALVAAVTRLDAMQAGGRAESDVGAIQRAVAVTAVASALGWALAEGLRRDARRRFGPTTSRSARTPVTLLLGAHAAPHQHARTRQE